MRLRSERLLILGGGHIGLALYRMALEAKFSVVVVTHGHKHDKAAAKNFIDCEYRYLRMIGSIWKVKQTLTELADECVSQERLNKIYAPIGLDIKAEIPAEIAVGILAELIQVRRIGKPSRISLVRIHEGADDKK
jgi:xanthine dehydrogenase accessory factor